MTAIDPYRTLEIAPGASQAEIKRAYRRLAKLYHPDSGGERALSRFLAIQAAYEMLVDEPDRPRTLGRGTAARPTPSPAWQADASRARATREAYRARTRRSTGSSGPAAGPPGSKAGSPPGAEHADGAGAGGAGAGGESGSADGAAGSNAGSRSRRSGRRTKATIGSTSYDGADREPFDPAWEGATWYGAGSGTYWTINPKEYADPRKHGPEYLARSRRATGGSAESTHPGDDVPPGTSEPPAEAGAGGTAGPTSGAASGDARGRRSETTGPATPAPERPAGSSGGDPRTRTTTEPRTGPSTDPPTVAPRPVRPSAPPPGPFATAAGVAGSPGWPGSSELQRAASTPPGRIVVALIGWIPLAVALAALTEAVPVCNVGTVCDDPLTGGLWIVDLAVIALLVAVPRLGWIAAIGSLAFFVAGLIATPVLLAVGGTQTAAGTAGALTVVLVVAWLAGVALALSGRVDLPPWRHGRVR